MPSQLCLLVYASHYLYIYRKLNKYAYTCICKHVYIYDIYIYIHIYSDKSTSTWSVVFHAPKKCSSFGNIIPFFRLNISHVCLWIFVKVLQAASMESTPRPPLSSYRPMHVLSKRSAFDSCILWNMRCLSVYIIYIYTCMHILSFASLENS